MKNIEPHVLTFLVGQECWGIVGGTGAGSMIRLLLGRKIPRAQPLSNDTLSPEIRKNDAEFSMCLFYCSWRLMSPEAIVCSGAWSSNEENGPMLTGLASIEHQKIVAVDLVATTLDLSIRFENGFRLDVFNDYPSEGVDDAAFWINSPDARYSVRGLNFDVTKQ